jgi:hypothetical protein
MTKITSLAVEQPLTTLIPRPRGRKNWQRRRRETAAEVRRASDEVLDAASELAAGPRELGEGVGRSLVPECGLRDQSARACARARVRPCSLRGAVGLEKVHTIGEGCQIFSAFHVTFPTRPPKC